VIVVDTSALIDSLCGTQRSLDQLTGLIDAGERLALPSIVLYEWLRGPRFPQELQFQEELFPRDQIFAFEAADAAVAADLYRRLRKPRGPAAKFAINGHRFGLAPNPLASRVIEWPLESADVEINDRTAHRVIVIQQRGPPRMSEGVVAPRIGARGHSCAVTRSSAPAKTGWALTGRRDAGAPFTALPGRPPGRRRSRRWAARAIR
jgi:predicted nucleic acid-binding protein